LPLGYLQGGVERSTPRTGRDQTFQVGLKIHPEGNPWANLKSISHRCYLFEVAFEWELTKETIVLPLGCLQGGEGVECG